MKPIPRRTFIGSVLALPLLSANPGGASAEGSERRGVRVLADQDRFGKRRKVFGALPIDVKVSAEDTNGGLLLIEQIDDVKGGPPRHVHHGQDEWFFVVSGHYVVEVGGERFELQTGDSVFAPRGVPHVWAHVGEETGRMMIGFQPAGEMEAFFAEATKLDGIPSGPEVAELFRAHGMEVLGPPLETA